MAEPLVSIIVTNYNYAPFLTESIDSALGQTYGNVEVVVVDDGSADNSKEIIESYGDRIVPVLKENGGHGSAANAGFFASKGDIIIYLDADDLLHREAAAKVVEAWKPGTATVQYYMELIDHEGHPIGQRFPREPLLKGNLKPLVISYGFYPFAGTCASAYGRHVLEQVMPMPEDQWRAAIDYYHSMTAVFFGDVVSLDEALAYYRLHDTNVTFHARGLTAEELRKRMARDYAIADAVHKIGDKQGFEVRDDLPLQAPPHIKKRLLSLRIDRAGHPWPEDGRFALALRGIKAAFNWPYAGVVKKLTTALAFIALSILPGSMLLRTADAMIGADSRSGPLSALLRFMK